MKKQFPLNYMTQKVNLDESFAMIDSAVMITEMDYFNFEQAYRFRARCFD